MENSRKSRVDRFGWAYAGSQLQVQIYVNCRSEEITHAVLEAIPLLVSLDMPIRWVSPLRSKKFAEYKDLAFLSAVGLDANDSALKEFWPRGGPVWDALGVIESDPRMGGTGVLLVEAKSHPPEIYGNGCQASLKSRKKIEAALEETKRWLGVLDTVDWTGPLYQSANRIAHLYFFREILKIPAWLVNLYFLNDPHSPTDRNEWQEELKKVKAELGLSEITVPNTAEVFLEASKRVGTS